MSKHFMKGICLAVMLALVPGLAGAKKLQQMQEKVEYSTMVTGNIDISANGLVDDVQLKTEALDDATKGKLIERIKNWRFEPVLDETSGVPRAVRAPINLHLVAKNDEAGQISISISSTHFGKYDPKDNSSLSYKKAKPPMYPMFAAERAVKADVYVVVKVGRDGRVMDVATQQVNLRTLMEERELDNYRRVFAKASESAVKKWTFNVPTEGEQKDAPYWVAQIPISFSFRGEPKPGPWRAYIPGPFQRVPERWMTSDDYAEAAPEALPKGGIHMVGQKAPRLLTEPEGI